jgi:hypothetical protein
MGLLATRFSTPKNLPPPTWVVVLSCMEWLIQDMLLYLKEA